MKDLPIKEINEDEFWWDDEDLDNLVEAQQGISHFYESGRVDVPSSNHRLSDHTEHVDSGIEVEQSLDLHAVLHHVEKFGLVGHGNLHNVSPQIAKVTRGDLDLSARSATVEMIMQYTLKLRGSRNM